MARFALDAVAMDEANSYLSFPKVLGVDDLLHLLFVKLCSEDHLAIDPCNMEATVEVR